MVYCTNCGRKQPDDNAEFCTFCGSKLNPSGGDGLGLSSGFETAGTEQAAHEGNKCDYCANLVPYSEIFRCKYCGGKFCYDHRLPENHLCKSASARRVIPTGESATSSSGAGSYSYSSTPRYGYSRRTGSSFGINISKQGKNLLIAIGLGFIIGSALTFIAVDDFLGGQALVYLFLEVDDLVYRGWIWQLVTSLIISPFGILGFVDVLFNAIALVWLDGLLSQAYSPKQYYAVFLATGVFGNIISLLNGPGVVSFGASGGIFGLIAGVVTIDYAVNRRFNPSLIGWFIFIFILSSLGGSVDILAHLGGAVLGFVMGYAIGKRRRMF